MPMKLNVGLSKKHGLPNYGSVGASCHLEVELDGSLLRDDLEGFHRHVRSTFIACRQAVHDELAQNRGDSADSDSRSAGGSHSQPQTASRTNGRTGHDGNGHGANGRSAQPASEKQQNYIQILAGEIRGLGARELEALCQAMFGCPLAELTSLDASSLIDTLKAIKEGQITLDDVLTGAAA